MKHEQNCFHEKNEKLLFLFPSKAKNQKRVFVFDNIFHPVWWEKVKSKTKTRFCFWFSKSRLDGPVLYVYGGCRGKVLKTLRFRTKYVGPKIGMKSC